MTPGRSAPGHVTACSAPIHDLGSRLVARFDLLPHERFSEVESLCDAAALRPGLALMSNWLAAWLVSSVVQHALLGAALARALLRGAPSSDAGGAESFREVRRACA